MTRIPLGAMEKWLLLEQATDASSYTNCLLVLDRAAEPALAAAALECLRPRAPVHFSRLVEGAGKRSIAAVYDERRPIDEFVRVHDQDTVHEHLAGLLDTPLDPVEEGFFRCHVVNGPTPLVALQSSHVAGDGFTNGWLRAAFVEQYNFLAGEGSAAVVTEPPAKGVDADLSCYALRLRDIQRAVPVAPVRYPAGGVRPMRHRELRMSEVTDDDVYELRTFRAHLHRDAFRSFFSRAAVLQITPLCYMGAALAVAMDRWCDDWCERPTDFLAVNFPRDLRSRAEWRNKPGNAVFPFGVPLLRDDLRNMDTAAVATQRTFEVARDNWIFYRVFAQQVRQAGKAEVARATLGRPRLERHEGRAILRPLAVFGVTELPHRRMAPSLGAAHIVDTYFQSPIIGRRFVDGGAQLSGTVRWHQAFDVRIRGMLQDFLNCLERGDAERTADIEWELIPRARE